MSAFEFNDQWLVVAGSGWPTSVEFFTDAAGTVEDDISACSAELTILRNGRPVSEAIVFSSTDNSPAVTITTNTVTVAVPKATTADWTPGLYDVKLRIIDGSLTTDRYVGIGQGKLTVKASIS